MVMEKNKIIIIYSLIQVKVNKFQNKIRDLFKVKLYTIRSETKKKEQGREREEREWERERERERKRDRGKESKSVTKRVKYHLN